MKSTYIEIVLHLYLKLTFVSFPESKWAVKNLPVPEEQFIPNDYAKDQHRMVDLKDQSQ